MAKPFEAATKRLVEADPLAWLRFLGLPGEQAELMDADLPHLVQRMEVCLDVEAPVEERGLLWTTTFLLLGLKYDREFASTCCKE